MFEDVCLSCTVQHLQTLHLIVIVSADHLRIGQGPQPVVVLLAGGVPEAEGDGHPVTHHRGGVVVKPAHRPASDFIV